MEKASVVILAAGNGSRMGSDVNKIFLELNGKPVLAHTISKFYDLDFVDDIVVVLNPRDFEAFEELVRRPYHFDKVRVAAGGPARRDSALSGLKALSPDTEYVLIHDGARPFVSAEVIRDCFDKVTECGAAVAAVPALSTMKRSRDGRFIDSTPPRDEMFEAQTPQGFSYPLIMEANGREWGEDHGFEPTDDSCLAEWAGYAVALSKGDKFNIKLTIPEDLEYAKVLVQFLSESV